MLFISNPRPSGSISYHPGNENTLSHGCTQRWDIIKLVITAVFFYVITSIFSIILYYPVSCSLLLFPSIVLLYTILVLKGYNRDCLWPSIIAGFAGFLLKLVIIIVFCSMFPIEYETNVVVSASPNYYWPSLDQKTWFFIVACTIEFVIIICACFYLWHLLSYNNATQLKLRHVRRSEQQL